MDSESFEGLPLAELVAHERRRRSLSLAGVAALVRRAAEDEGRQSGATRQTAHNWERGQLPRPDSLRWLARALGIPTEKVADAAARQAAMRRRELLRGATLLVGGALLPGPRSSTQTSAGLGDVMLAATELDEVIRVRRDPTSHVFGRARSGAAGDRTVRRRPRSAPLRSSPRPRCLPRSHGGGPRPRRGTRGGIHERTRSCSDRPCHGLSPYHHRA
jgi:transcriptional regulator with XRE-family HTH domain